ncbi:hypothetical protein HO173_001839 [Letharia columbiana]|uniref:DUF1993 domain-containing protein n=1 Tax=Letharia columbiana TaxID=112416 RepID=A0A8H6G447_9LECA|nr:uncharacterized protein HO173_001839 [Letharia columbiana]KAF6240228.1 hypothetical protein HO173_001839 [Letharia columbiana]
MPLSLYDITVPVFIRGLTNLSAILSKGSTYADAQNLPPAHLLEARLIEDMAALPYQIQRVSDHAKDSAARLAGVEAVPMPDDETTFEELQTRIQKTIDFLKTVPEDGMDGKEEEEIVLNVKVATLEFTTAKSYVLDFVLPNFYFHLTTAYDILRHNGVPVGKLDYIGSVKMKAEKP